MTRKVLVGTAVGLAGLALRPDLNAQTPQSSSDLQDHVDDIDKRLAAIEKGLMERSAAGDTPAAGALDTRLTRVEMRLSRLESKVYRLSR